MGRPKGLFPTLEEAARRYERESGRAVAYVIVAPKTAIRLDRAATQRMFTRRVKTFFNERPPLSGRAFYLWDREADIWQRACFIPRGADDLPNADDREWLTGRGVPTSEVAEGERPVPAEQARKLRAQGADLIPDHMPAFRLGLPPGWGFTDIEQASAYWKRAGRFRRDFPDLAFLDDSVA